MVLRHQFVHHLNGTLEVEVLSRAYIEFKSNCIHFILALLWAERSVPLGKY